MRGRWTSCWNSDHGSCDGDQIGREWLVLSVYIHPSLLPSAEPYAAVRRLLLLLWLVMHMRGHPAEDGGLLAGSVISMIDEIDADSRFLGCGWSAHLAAV